MSITVVARSRSTRPRHCHSGRTPASGVLRQAMAYGTALASFNVEECGTERVVRLAATEIHERVAELRAMTQFEHAPVRVTIPA
jgi:hypothetical protein